jgi:hypothetical protein
MGANTVAPVGQPVLQLQLCDAETHLKFGTVMEVHPATVELPDPDTIPCYGKPRYEGSFGIPTGSYDNNDFYAETAEYLKERFRLCPIGVAITNSATTSAEAVLVTMEVRCLCPADLADEADLPIPPARSAMTAHMGHLGPSHNRQISVEHYDAIQEVRIKMGEVHAGRTEYSKGSLYVTGDEAATVSMKVTISAKNLRIPVTSSVTIHIVPTALKLSVQEVVKLSKTID